MSNNLLKADILEFQKLKERHPTYRAFTSCLNCGQGFETNIPKGTTLRQFNPPCPNCGCTIADIAREWAK